MVVVIAKSLFNMKLNLFENLPNDLPVRRILMALLIEAFHAPIFS